MDKLVIGCGYLGSRVASLWKAQGHRVLATTRSPARADELRGLGCEPILCDVLDPDSLRKLPAVTTAFHGIGLDRRSGRSMREVCVDGLRNLLDVLPRPGKFLFISSTSVYGQTGGEEVDETAITEPLDESGRVVLEAERVLRERLPDAVILRFAGIYGPGRLVGRQAVIAGELIVGNPDRWLNLIHVDDGAAVVLAAEERGGPSEVCNVSDRHPVQRRDYYTRLAQLLGAPEPRFVRPPPGDPGPIHERTNRRIDSRRLAKVLQVPLRYPSCVEGMEASQ